MKWESVDAFFAMGGYAFYVWGSFAATALALALEPVLLNMRRRRAIETLRLENAAKESA